jgi:hypothetical protein
MIDEEYKWIHLHMDNAAAGAWVWFLSNTSIPVALSQLIEQQ